MRVRDDIAGEEALYRALSSRDGRLDGVVFYGIVSTGIYCRPVCPARTPKISNCRFYRSAAAAQAAGFRPCLRCRPETAPRCPAWQGTSATVSRALALIEEGALDGDAATVDQLAERLGVGERQLRRLFLKHLGASPIAVAQTRRVLFAKQLLHDTALPMAAVAEAAGFGSERRFHEVFQAVFQRPPSAIRRAGTTDALARSEQTTLRIRYRGAFDYDHMLRVLAGRCRTGVDAVDREVYRRVLDGTNSGTVWVRHDAKRSSLLVTVEGVPLKRLPEILSRVRRLFDTDVDMARVEEFLSQDRLLAPLVRARPGLRLAGEWEPASQARYLLDDGFPMESAAMLRMVQGMDGSIKTQRALERRSARWRPWRAYAAQHLMLAGEGDEQ